MKPLDLIKPGDLVFDVGANVGYKTADYLARGARVVAFEPHPNAAHSLREVRGKGAIVVQKALGAQPGSVLLNLCEASEISTMAEHWKRPPGRFHVMKWGDHVMVEVTTLDAAIAEYGKPSFIKIDVEGYEREVLAGLSTKVDALSFEFAYEYNHHADECIARLVSQGYTEFTVGDGEHTECAEWQSAEAVLIPLHKAGWGDVYAR